MIRLGSDRRSLGVRRLLAGVTLAVGGVVSSLLVIEGALRLIDSPSLTYVYPEFQVTDVRPEDAQVQMAEPMFGAAFRYISKPWQYGLKRDLKGRFRSSEFDVGFETDSLGLRGGIPASGGRVRVLGLGDSFAMGFGVEQDETYLSVLGDRLSQTRVDAGVINAGVVGYGIRHSYEYLVGEGIKYMPNVVVLQLWVGDDLYTASGAGRPLAVGNTPQLLLLKRMARQSYAAMLVRDRLRAFGPARAWLMSRGLITPLRRADDILRSDLEVRWQSHFSSLASLLGRFQSFCSEHEARFVVLIIPMKEQVYDRYWRQNIAYNDSHPDSALVDLDAPNRILRRIAHEAGVELVDMLDRFREHSADTALYFDIDPHLTREGHRLVAIALYDHLSAPEPGPVLHLQECVR